MNYSNEPPLDCFGFDSKRLDQSGQDLDAQTLTDTVSTLIAIDSSLPIRPNSQSLATIYRKITVVRPSLLRPSLFLWTGWAAAAVLAAILLTENKQPQITQDIVRNTNQSDTLSHPVASAKPPETTHPQSLDHDNSIVNAGNSDTKNPLLDASLLRDQQRSLIQEIEILKERVASLASQNQARLTVTDGVAWPIIMKLTSPRHRSAATTIDAPLLSALLTDANTLENATSLQSKSTQADVAPEQLPQSVPSAVPIYDPARDIGQLLISNLENPAQGQSYYLWVETDTSTHPVLVGTVPENIAQSERFDFQLGSTTVIPKRFLITEDASAAPRTPNNNNIILEGPSSAQKK